MKKLTVPPEITDGIERIAQEKSIPKEQLLADLTKIMHEDAVVSKLPGDEEKIQAAWGVLASSYVSIGGATKEVLIQPLSVGAARVPKNRAICAIFALTIVEGEPPIFSKYTAWGDKASELETLSTDICYKLKARITKNKLGITGVVDDDSMFREVERELIDEVDYLTELYADPNRRCTIADAPNNVSAKKNDIDIRVIEGTVVSVSPTRNGESAVFNIIDKTFTSAGKFTGMTVYANLDQLKGGVGSKGYFAGSLAVRDQSAESPEVVMRHAVFAPTIITDYIEG